MKRGDPLAPARAGRSEAASVARSTELPITIPVFVALACLVWLATRRPGGSIDFFERGHWLGPASDMLVGKVPYREIFPVHGFLSDGGLDVLLFVLFGPDFSLSLTVHHLLGCLVQPSLYLVAAAATRRPLLAAAAIPLYLSFATERVADRPVLPVLALAAFLWAIQEPARKGRSVVAGVLSGLGFLYALEFGSFVLFAELVTLVFHRLAVRQAHKWPLDVRYFSLGVGAVLGPFAGYLLAFDALVPFLRTSFIDLPRWIHRVWGWDFPTPWGLVSSWSQGEAFRMGGLTIGFGVAKRLYLAPVLSIVGIFVAWRLRNHATHRLLALRLLAVSVACAAFFRYVVARLHLEVGNALTGPLLLVILVGTYNTWGAELGRLSARRVAVALVLTGILMGIGMNAVARTYWLLRDAAASRARMNAREGLVPLAGARGANALVPPNENREIAALAAYVDHAVPEGEPILELTNRPALHFFLRRSNAVRFYQVPLMQPFQEEVLRELRENPPALVLFRRDTPYDTVEGIPNPARIVQVWRYLQEKYPRRIQVGETLIGLPESSAGPREEPSPAR